MLTKRLKAFTPLLVALALIFAPYKLGAAPANQINFENAFSDLYIKVRPHLASIRAVVAPDPNAPAQNNANQTKTVTLRVGAGFVWTSDGYIVTASHIFDANISEIRVMIEQNNYKARLVGRDPPTDIALIKIDTKDPLKPVKVGDSDLLKIGEWVAALGDPFTLTASFTHGIVSGKNRNLNNFLDEFLQIDAALNPGNSGGPLFNLNGEVVGMNSAIVENSNNTAFAVPINLIKLIVPILKQKGKVERSWLGVEFKEAWQLTPEELSKFKLNQIKLNPESLVITGVTPKSPADTAGLEAGDVILGYNEQKTKDSLEFIRFIRSRPIGSWVSLKIERQNKITFIKVKLEEWDYARPSKNAFSVRFIFIHLGVFL